MTWGHAGGPGGGAFLQGCGRPGPRYRASGHDELLAWSRTDELGAALEHLAAAALVLGRRYGLEHASWWARINVLTRGRLLTMAPAG